MHLSMPHSSEGPLMNAPNFPVSRIASPRSLRSARVGALFLGFAALSAGCGVGDDGAQAEAASLGQQQQALAGYPSTCQELKSANPSAADGEYSLYVNGDPARLWRAYC